MRQHAVLFISFVFLFGLTSCSTETEVLETALLERQGLAYQVNSDTPFTGLVVSYYDNGQYEYKKNYKDGKQHGLYEKFYENGQLQAKGNYKDGKQHGLYEQFSENGQLQAKWNLKDGELHGPFEAFSENGQLQAKWNLKDGKEHGPFEVFYDNGQLRAKVNYKDGEQHGFVERFDEDGNLMAKENHPEEPGLTASERRLAYHREYAAAKARQLVSIPGGTFRMGDLSGEGDGDELPVHSVTVPAFRLGKYEVTFALWDACVEDGGCDGYSPDDQGWGRGNRPVVNVSWDDAQSLISWLNRKKGANYRLPTEAEWEYAARAGSTTKYSWGNDIGDNRANCGSDCGDSYPSTATTPVGSFPANAWGLHDMHGNVGEWVQDCWNESYEGAPTDGGAWESGDCNWRVLRGGSWAHYASALRSADRNRYPRTDRSSIDGFRLAQDQ